MVEKLYTVEQISEMIGMHPKTIRRYIRKGRLKAQKIGKFWRVNGHDLSVFLEGTSDVEKDLPTPGLQAIVKAASPNIKVSTVVDIPVQNNAEASQVVNWIAASLNSKTNEYGHTSMTSQYIQPENIVRIMLWGSPSFMEVILSSLRELGV